MIQERFIATEMVYLITIYHLLTGVAAKYLSLGELLYSMKRNLIKTNFQLVYLVLPVFNL